MWRPQVGSRWAPFILALLAVTNAGAGCVDDIAPAHTVGAGTFCILGFCLYDARLIASSVPVSFDGRFALELTYRRAIHGERLVKAGMDEIERLAEPPRRCDEQSVIGRMERKLVERVFELGKVLEDGVVQQP